MERPVTPQETDSLFEEFYTRHHAWLLAWLIRITCDTDLAADVSQTVWTKVYVRWASLRIDGSGAALLKKIALNVLLDLGRSQARRPCEVPLDDDPDESGKFRDRVATGDPDPLDCAIESEQARIVQQIVATLSDDERILVKLIVDDGLPAARAAERMECSQAAVTARRFRVMVKLRRLAHQRGLR